MTFHCGCTASCPRLLNQALLLSHCRKVILLPIIEASLTSIPVTLGASLTFPHSWGFETLLVAVEI